MPIRYLSGVNVDSNTLVVDAANDRVGIGTASPSYKLDINGVTRFQDIVRFKTNAWNLSDDGYSRFYFSNNSRTYFGSGDGYEWRSAADTALVVLANGGDVGIGTTSPATKLDVNGGINIANGNNLTWGGTYAAGIPTITGYNAGTGGALYFYPNGSTSGEKMRLHASGNLSIGNTNDTYKLDVTGTGRFTDTLVVKNTSSTPSIWSGSYGGAISILGDNATSNRYIDLSIVDSTGALAAQGLRIVNSGNVGIGTTAPGAKLQIGDYSTSGGNTLAILNSSGNQVLRLADYSAYYGFDIVNDDAGYLHIIRHANSVAGTSALTIKRDDGNVGIGTTSPGFKLHIKSSSLNSYPLVVQRAANTNNIFYIYEDGSGNGTLTLENSGGGATVSIKSDGTSYLNGGNVGIGTTSPAYKLDVAGTGAFSGNVAINGTIIGTDQTFGGAYRTFAFGANSNGYNRIFAANDATDGLYLNAATGQGINFRVNGGGANVLVVASTGAATFSSSVEATSFIKTSGTSSQYLMADGSVSTLTNPVTGTGTTNYVPKFTSASAIGDSNIYDNGGNIGIGTTNPGVKLQVTGGSADTSGQVIIGGTATDYTSGIDFYTSTTGRGFVGWRGLSSAAPYNAYGMYLVNYDNSPIIFGTATGGRKMSINDNGNVLIGTTTDAGYKLAVSGTGYYSGQLTVDGFTNNSGISFRDGSDPTNVGIRAKAVGTANRDGLELLGANGIDFTVNNGANVAMRIVGITGSGMGNVGIGTTAPITKLSIGAYSGSRLPYINATANTFDANGITVTSSNTANATIGGGIDLTNNVHSVGSFSPLISFSALSQSGTYNNNYAAIYGILAGAGGDANWNTGHIVFATAESYGASEKMRITSAGNVGIGTTAPAQKLHVYEASGSSQAYLLVQNNRARNAAVYTKTTVGGFYAGTSIGTDTLCYQIYDDSAGERLRVTSDGYLRMASGSLGIQFGGDTAAANALDDYEEGTWTMGVSFGGASVGVTTSANTGTYTKIGRKVTVNGYLLLSSKGSSTGVAKITGLPFTIPNSATNYSAASLFFINISFTNQFQSFGEISTTGFVLEQITLLGATSAINDTNFANNSGIILSFTYFV